MTEVVIPYVPRKLQRKVHNELDRFNVIVCHRRWGKTVFAINELIRTVLTKKTKTHPNPRVAYLCPLHKQAKTVAWDYAKQFSRPVPGITINEAELRIDYPNGGRLQLFGADNPDALRGIYLDQVVMDEYAQMSPRAWSEVIRPALSDREGGAIFIGTPRGHNNFYEVYQRAETLPGWSSALYKASETDILNSIELAAAKREMTEAEYAQEYECSWQAAIKGAYYGSEMESAEPRIRSVPYDETLQVITSWDLGISDSTSIWFWQVAGAEIRAINYLEFQGMGLPDIVKEIETLDYQYQQHIFPHDVKVRELGSGKSRVEILRSLGIEASVAPNQSIADGIAAFRSMISRIWFDKENCAEGIEALKQYRTEYNDKTGVFRNSPLHDWSSHAADSARYFAITPLYDISDKWAKLDRSRLDRAAG